MSGWTVRRDLSDQFDFAERMVLGRRLRVWRRNRWAAPYCRRGYGLILFGCGPWSGILSLYPAPRARP